MCASDAQAVFNMVPSCSVDASTAGLNALVASAGPGLRSFFAAGFQCTSALPVWQPSVEAIESRLLCGFKSVGAPLPHAA